MTDDQEVRSFQRSVVLVIATSAAVLCIGFAVDWVHVRLRAPETASALTACLTIVVPVAAWITHYIWQSPRRSSILLPTATTLTSLLFGWVLVVSVGSWLHVQIGGGL